MRVTAAVWVRKWQGYSDIELAHQAAMVLRADDGQGINERDRLAWVTLDEEITRRAVRAMAESRSVEAPRGHRCEGGPR